MNAIFASLKAFLVNRVGDFGFLLGTALILTYAGSFDYVQVFGKAAELANQSIQIFPGMQWALISVICILLFVGAARWRDRVCPIRTGQRYYSARPRRRIQP